MLAQFILLVWSASLLPALLPRWFGQIPALAQVRLSTLSRWILLGVAAAGFIGAVFNLAYDRFFIVYDDRFVSQDRQGWLDKSVPAREWGERTYALRQAFCYIRSHYPLSAIVQNNPQTESQVLTQGMYGMRQTVAAGPEYIFIYGDTLDRYQSVAVGITPLFQANSQSYPQVQEACLERSIDILVVKDIDPVWQAANSWVWQAAPVFSNDRVRVYACGGSLD